MNDTQELTGRPGVRPQLGDVKTAVVARVNDHVAAPAAVNTDLLGLVNGLQQLNPELTRLANNHLAEGRAAAMDAARADAYKAESPRDALTGDPVPVPENVPPAFGEVYRDGFRNVLTQRAAVETVNGIEAAYSSQKDTPDFNVKTFLAEEQRKALAGLSDPSQVAAMGRHLDETKARILAADNQRMVLRHEVEKKQTMAQLAINAMKPDDTPDGLFQKANWLVDQGAAIQVHPEDAVKSVLERVTAMSMDAEGKPELFDLFDKPNAEGRTLRMLAPELGNTIDAAKQHARGLRDKATMEATEGDRFEVYAKLDKMVDTTPELVTPELVKPYMGKFGLSAEKAASYLNHARDAMARKQLTGEAMQAYDMGMLGRYEPGVQQKVLEAKLGPALNATWATFAGAGNATPEQRQVAVQSLAEQIIQAHSQARATVPVDALARLVTSTATSLPDPQGPSPQFQAVAALHRALSGAPQYRDMYFKSDTEDVVRTYNALVNEQHLDPNTAYQKAYLLNSPAEKERMAAKAMDPAFAKDVAENAKKFVEGATFWRLFGLFNGRPQNDAQVGDWAVSQMKTFWKQNPHLSQAEVEDKVGRLVRENWVMDGESRQAIKVPVAAAGPLTQAAFTDYTKTITETLKKQGNFPDGSYIHYAPTSDDGVYSVEVWNGSMVRTMPEPVQLGKLVQRYNTKSNLQKDEAQLINDTILKLRKGEDTQLLDPKLVYKGKSAGFISSEDARLLNTQYLRSTFKDPHGATGFDLGNPSGDNTLENARGALKIDPKLTAKTALDLAFKSGLNAPTHLDLAASLVATREGVSLAAYEDPARGAGLNIGAGYNLRANAATVDTDLKAVGVPQERLGDIKTGKASLTPEQAKMLTQLAVKRYEGQVQKVAEGVKPGLWSTLTPQQRAVMIDVAYQTGDASQYRKAWEALAKGDKASFQQELKTFYTPKGGTQKVEDRRSLDLRSSMLQGPSAWKARLMVASK